MSNVPGAPGIDLKRASNGKGNPNLAGAKPSDQRFVGVAPVNRQFDELRGLTSSNVRSIIEALKRGQGREWIDHTQKMLMMPIIKSVWESRLAPIVGAELIIEPAEHPNTMLAEAGAALARDEMNSTPDLVGKFKHLLHANGTGWAVMEHIWTEVPDPKRGGLRFSSNPTMVLSREIAFQNDWTMRIYTFGNHGAKFGTVMVPLVRPPQGDEVDRKKFIIHFGNQAGAVPTLSGDLLSVIWHHFYLLHTYAFRQKGLERFAHPLPYAIMGPDTSPEIKQAMLVALQEMTADSVGVFDQGVTIELLEPKSGSTGKVGEPATLTLQDLRNEVIIALLGSADNVDADSGSFARAVSQSATTIRPRLEFDAQSLARTLEGQWLSLLMRFNRHLFGGQTPPTPRVRFKLASENPEPISAEEVMAGLPVTKNEWRASKRLEPLSPEEGGDEWVVPVAKRRVPKGAGRTRPETSPDQLGLPQVADSQPAQEGA